MIAIVDYGIGNVGSVLRSIEECGYSAIITNQISELKESSHIILPGVGSFTSAMMQLEARKLIEPLTEIVFEKKTPFLGICLGMQLLGNSGEENNEHTKGLGWIPGEVKKIPTNLSKLPLPHVGWNNIEMKKNSPIFQNIPNNSNFYFVHSYYFAAKNSENNVLATVNYGEDLPVIINRNNIYGFQFHPEKSQKIGLKLLKNFLSIS